MPELTEIVRAANEVNARNVAIIAMESRPTDDGRRFYALRVIETKLVDLDEDRGGGLMYRVTVQGEYMTESEARALGGDR